MKTADRQQQNSFIDRIEKEAKGIKSKTMSENLGNDLVEKPYLSAGLNDFMDDDFTYQPEGGDGDSIEQADEPIDEASKEDRVSNKGDVNTEDNYADKKEDQEDLKNNPPAGKSMSKKKHLKIKSNPQLHTQKQGLLYQSSKKSFSPMKRNKISGLGKSASGATYMGDDTQMKLMQLSQANE